MLLILQKTAAALVMPYALVALGLVLLGVLIVRRHPAAPYLCAALAAIQILTGWGLTAHHLQRSLEAPSLQLDPLDGTHYATVAVLGGGTSETNAGVAQVAEGGDRVLLAARMALAGQVDQIYCTGEDLGVTDPAGKGPAAEAAEILQALGVPGERIAQIGGRNTLEEMRALSKVLDPDARNGLITSAQHMPRALRLARAQGLELIPLPADFRTTPAGSLTPLDWVPTAEQSYRVSLVLKEWLAWCVGR